MPRRHSACGAAASGESVTILTAAEVALLQAAASQASALPEAPPPAALEVMDEILALRDEHGLVLENEFRFRHAQAAYAAGLTEAAIESLNEYLLAAGDEVYCH